jgi:hypothetical protein
MIPDGGFTVAPGGEQVLVLTLLILVSESRGREGP